MSRSTTRLCGSALRAWRAISATGGSRRRSPTDFSPLRLRRWPRRSRRFRSRGAMMSRAMRSIASAARAASTPATSPTPWRFPPFSSIHFRRCFRPTAWDWPTSPRSGRKESTSPCASMRSPGSQPLLTGCPPQPSPKSKGRGSRGRRSRSIGLRHRLIHPFVAALAYGMGLPTSLAQRAKESTSPFARCARSLAAIAISFPSLRSPRSRGRGSRGRRSRSIAARSFAIRAPIRRSRFRSRRQRPCGAGSKAPTKAASASSIATRRS